MNEKNFNEGNQIHNFMSSSGSGTVINYGSGSGSEFSTSYCSGSGSTSQKVTVPTVPVPQHCPLVRAMDPDPDPHPAPGPSFSHKCVERSEIMPAK